MLGHKLWIHLCRATRLLLPLLICGLIACNKSSSQAQAAASKKDINAEETSCGALLDQYQAILSNEVTCSEDRQCAWAEVSPVGCWTLFHQSQQAALEAIAGQLQQARCRVFLPTFKCAPKPAIAPSCIAGHCTWKQSK